MTAANPVEQLAFSRPGRSKVCHCVEEELVVLVEMDDVVPLVRLFEESLVRWLGVGQQRLAPVLLAGLNQAQTRGHFVSHESLRGGKGAFSAAMMCIAT